MNLSFDNVIATLEDIREDGVPKSIKNKLGEIISILRGPEEPSICRSKALQELEVVAEHAHVQSHSRMQIFNVVSMLEGL